MAKTKACIAIIDDDRDILTAAELLLKRHFERVLCFSDPCSMADAMASKKIDIFLLDMNFALGVNDGAEGLKWLQYILKKNEQAAVVLMTAYGNIETSVNAIKLGAADFVLKPWQNDKLLATLNAAISLHQRRQSKEHQPFCGSLSERFSGDSSNFPHDSRHIIAKDPSMLKLLRLTQKAAKSDVNVLILGENGTGKEVIANELHRLSLRSQKPLVSVDLGAIPETLFESELFGHKKGAFTNAHASRVGRFQAAEGGTLFLDEIGNLSLPLQAKLLRVLEQREVTPLGSDNPIPVNVRLVCATNSSLQKLVDEGLFRPDLFYRINTIQLSLPTLRERVLDVPLLLEFFIARHSKQHNLPPKKIDKTALKRLCAYEWPGNVRELSHSVERALILSDSGVLTESDFLIADSPSRFNVVTIQKDSNSHEIFYDCNLERIEKITIEHALAKYEGNVSHAAQELGITRTSLYRRIKKYEL